MALWDVHILKILWEEYKGSDTSIKFLPFIIYFASKSLEIWHERAMKTISNDCVSFESLSTVSILIGSFSFHVSI